MNSPANLAALLEGFFSKRLIAQRRASLHTVASYRDTFRLLLGFAEERCRCAPSKLSLEQINAPFVVAFLDQLERKRTNGARSRNLRLAAIRSFFRYAALEAPEHSALIQRVLAIPRKTPHPAPDRLPGAFRDRSPVGGTGSADVDRTTRSRSSVGCGANRPATIGVDRVAPAGRLAWYRCPCPLRGQGPQGASDATHETGSLGCRYVDPAAR